MGWGAMGWHFSVAEVCSNRAALRGHKTAF